jgi:hypothetical protein
VFDQFNDAAGEVATARRGQLLKSGPEVHALGEDGVAIFESGSNSGVNNFVNRA